MLRDRRTPHPLALAILFCLLAALPPSAWGLDAARPAAAAQVIGRISAIDAHARRLTVVSDAGISLQVTLGADTVLLRLAPGQTSLQGAQPLSYDELRTGDRVLVRAGRPVADGVDGPRQVLVMAQADLAAQEQQQQSAWRERGLSGTVTAIDAVHGQVLLRPAGLRLREPVTIDLGSATLRRYAEQSVRFADARPASLADMAVGNPMRVLGQRSADGTRYVAEQAVFGTFRALAASVESIDLAARRLTVKDLESRVRLMLVLAPDAIVRRLPAETAALLGAGGPPGARGPRPQSGGERHAGVAGRLPEEFAERLPAMSLDDLHKGDWVGAVVAPQAVDGATLTFNLLAGIEALAARTEAPGTALQVGLPAGLLDAALGVQ